MKKTLVILTLLCTISQGHAFSVQGGNLSGVNRMFLAPSWESPSVLKPGKYSASIDLDYSNEFMNLNSTNWLVLTDMETFGATVGFSAGFFMDSEISVKAPFSSLHDGFLDQTLCSYHDALGVGNSGRDARPDNEFAYSVTSYGDQWFSDSGQASGLGDIQISINKQIWKNETWWTSVKGTVKLPTGDADSGLGSGGCDAQIMALADWQVHEKWLLSGGGGHTWLSTPDYLEGLDVSISSTLFAGLGIKFNWTEAFAILCQSTIWASPYDNTGINALDDAYGEICFGGQYTWQNGWTIEVTLSEDLTRAAADFTLHSGVSVKF